MNIIMILFICALISFICGAAKFPGAVDWTALGLVFITITLLAGGHL
jgi:hypothetical protein